MRSRSLLLALVLPTLPLSAAAGEVLFEDNFDSGLSPKWQIIGFEKDDYRLRDGGLEIRVPTTLKEGATLPMIKVVLPFASDDTVFASVDVTPLDRFTRDGEFAGLYLTDEDGPEFAAKKMQLDGRLVFAPGDVDFRGKEGEEGDPSKYAQIYLAATPDDGPVRILVDRGYAFFQVGPNVKDKGRYLNFFYSAIQGNRKERGFCLTASGAPAGAEHWVRFDNFRVAHR